MDLVSVVIPCYRHEKYIAGCLESVYRQSYAEIELIVIDDCSTDQTFNAISDICASTNYQKRFPKIIFMQNGGNMGAHATINRGVRMAHGNYIALLNSDDEYHPERLAALMNLFRENGGEFAFSNFVFMDDDNREISFNPLYCELQSSIASGVSDYPALGFIFLQKQVALSTGNFFFSRRLFEKVGGFLNLKYCHDWDFVLQTLRHCEPLFLNRPLYRYRLHSENSFRSLESVALAETEFCLSRFFAACHFEKIWNALAPCSINWPGIFNLFLNQWGLEKYYTRAVTGYHPWHKVINPSAQAAIFAKTSYLDK